MDSARLAAVIAICGLVGCVEEVDRAGGAGWVKPDGTYAAFQKDTDDCRRVATLAPIRYTGPSSQVAEANRRYQDCMIDHGWTLDPHIAKDAMKETVDCKLPTVDQVQRTSARDCHNRYGKILDPK